MSWILILLTLYHNGAQKNLNTIIMVQIASPTCATIMYQTVQRKSNFVQLGTEYTYGQTYMHMQGRPVEIHTPTHLNLIGRSKIAPLPVLSPSSILPTALVSMRFTAMKNSAPLQMRYFAIFFCLSLHNLKFRYVGQCLPRILTESKNTFVYFSLFIVTVALFRKL